MSKYNFAYVCNYFKALIIPHTPCGFVVAESFRYGLTDSELLKSMEAFREFLHLLFDKLAAADNKIDVESGKKYDPYGDKGPRGSGKISYCFPVMRDLPYILIALGINGKLETSPKIKLIVNGKDVLTAICPTTEKYPENYHRLLMMNNERKLEMFSLLSALGLRFHGVDFANEVDLVKAGQFSITSEINEYVVAGLKLIAEATMHHKSYIKAENLFYSAFFRCDFNSLASVKPKKHSIQLSEFIKAQPPEIIKWIMDVDKYLKDCGCKLSHSMGGDEFTYTKRSTGIMKGRVLRIHIGIGGCFGTPGINHLKYSNNILGVLPDHIVDMVANKTNPTHGTCGHCIKGDFISTCKNGGRLQFNYRGEDIVRCRFTSFRIPLDNAEYRELVRKWIEMELTTSSL